MSHNFYNLLFRVETLFLFLLAEQQDCGSELFLREFRNVTGELCSFWLGLVKGRFFGVLFCVEKDYLLDFWVVGPLGAGALWWVDRDFGRNVWDRDISFTMFFFEE